MISRHWKGIAKTEEAGNYIKHLKEDTFPKLSGLKGFIKASILKREAEKGTEFLIITEWDSIEAIKSFAGENLQNAVVPDVVKLIMLDYDKIVSHYELEFSIKNRNFL